MKNKIILAVILFLGISTYVLFSTDLTAQSGSSKKINTAFSKAGVEFGGYFSSIDSLTTQSTKITETFDASWIKGKTVYTVLALTSPAADNGDTCRVIFEGAIKLQASQSNYDWFPCDTISSIPSKQAQTYALYVNSFSGRFDLMRLRVENQRTGTVTGQNRDGKALYFSIISDGTNFPFYGNGMQWH